jgi:hypothetical protein
MRDQTGMRDQTVAGAVYNVSRILPPLDDYEVAQLEAHEVEDLLGEWRVIATPHNE